MISITELDLGIPLIIDFIGELSGIIVSNVLLKTYSSFNISFFN